MTEHAGEFEWRREGEEAEVVLFAPDETGAERGLERALPFAQLPGAQNPIYAAATREDFGCLVSSSSHISPDLLSVPERGVMLVVEAVGAGRPSARDLTGLVMRELSATRVSAPSENWIQRLSEEGASAAAEEGLIYEEDLAFFSAAPGDPDALGQRAISAGVRGWRERPGTAEAFEVVEILDSAASENLGLERGFLVLVLRSGAGDLGRLTIGAHRERIRARAEEFGTAAGPTAAPFESEEAPDLLAATNAAANFADGRMSLLIHAARRAAGETVGEIRLQAAWRIGGLEHVAAATMTHRMNLAAVEDGQTLISTRAGGGVVGCSTGNMSGSVPPFGSVAFDGRDVWEEAGLLARWARLASEDRG